MYSRSYTPLDFRSFTNSAISLRASGSSASLRNSVVSEKAFRTSESADEVSNVGFGAASARDLLMENVRRGGERATSTRGGVTMAYDTARGDACDENQERDRMKCDVLSLVSRAQEERHIRSVRDMVVCGRDGILWSAA